MSRKRKSILAIVLGALALAAGYGAWRSLRVAPGSGLDDPQLAAQLTDLGYVDWVDIAGNAPPLRGVTRYDSERSYPGLNLYCSQARSGALLLDMRGNSVTELAALAAIPEALDDQVPVDLTGLSCRWAPLRSRLGKMLTLIIHGAADPRAIYTTLMRLAGQDGDPLPVRVDNLRAHWPPKNFMLEARARCRDGWLPLWAARVLAETLFAKLVIVRGKPLAGFDPQRYREEVSANTDFCKFDRTLCVVIDCALERIDTVQRYLAECAAAQTFEWGMDVSDTALMTCLVTSEFEGLHVHFVDGGGGGYTNAAKKLKAARAGPAAG